VAGLVAAVLVVVVLVVVVLVVAVLVAAGGGAGVVALATVVTAEEAVEVTAETAEVSPLPEGLWSAVAASACRENTISRNSIPAAPIANCAARRATRRMIGRGITSSPLTGKPIIKHTRRTTVRPSPYNFAGYSRNDHAGIGRGKNGGRIPANHVPDSVLEQAGLEESGS
jgi:hypothetical protein